MKNTIIAFVLLVIIGVAGFGAYYLAKNSAPAPVVTTDTMSTTTQTTTATTTTTAGNTAVIGTSVQGRDITAYHYGSGTDEILFVGGLHGAYESNTILLSYNLMDYLTAHPEAIPANETVTVIPVANPDGLAKVVGTTSARFTAADLPATLAATIPGRFNANKVDLNRNFDCDWKESGTWQSTTVSGGTKPFSEPETQAIENYVTAHKLTAAVSFYSSLGGVYASGCDTVSPESIAITKAYAAASGYPAHQTFDAYATTGDFANWLAKINVPAVSVLLTNHTDTDWSKNQAGVTALLNHYAK